MPYLPPTTSILLSEASSNSGVVKLHSLAAVVKAKILKASNRIQNIWIGNAGNQILFKSNHPEVLSKKGSEKFRKNSQENTFDGVRFR